MANEEYANGDLFDENTGEQIGTIDMGENSSLISLPVNISLFYNGFFYVFKMDSKYENKEEKVNDQKDQFENL